MWVPTPTRVFAKKALALHSLFFRASTKRGEQEEEKAHMETNKTKAIKLNYGPIMASKSPKEWSCNNGIPWPQWHKVSTPDLGAGHLPSQEVPTKQHTHSTMAVSRWHIPVVIGVALCPYKKNRGLDGQ